MLLVVCALPAVAQAPGVTDDSFMADVIEASKQKPVFVNLYAVWCAPCRPLFPKLERAAAAQASDVKLVSLDIDDNQRSVDTILTMLDKQEIKRPPNMQIPALVAFRDGKPTGLLIGAHHELEAVGQFMALSAGPGAARRSWR